MNELINESDPFISSNKMYRNIGSIINGKNENEMNRALGHLCAHIG